MIEEPSAADRELLAVYDFDGRRIGTKSRTEVHRDGDLHWVSFLLAAWRESEGGGIRFLLQIRGRPGDPYIGQVDCPAGGHVAASESHRDAIIRECREETGIELEADSLVYLGARRLDNPTGVCRNVVDHFYLFDRPVRLEELVFTEEANGFVEVDLEEFAELVDGRRERVAGTARTEVMGSEIHPIEISFDHLSAYSTVALDNFRRVCRAVVYYFENDKVDMRVWDTAMNEHPIAQSIIDLLAENQCWYDTFQHEAVRTSVEAAEQRADYTLHQGAKAIIARIKVPNEGKRFVMLVFPADNKFDTSKVKRLLGAKDIRFATEEEVEEITDGVQPGGVPPFGNRFGLEVIADPSLFGNEKIVFNAGRTTSIAMLSADYRRFVAPQVGEIV